MSIPSGQSAWTFSSALANAMSSASVLTGLLMVTAPPGGSSWFMGTGCRFGRHLSRGPMARYLAAPLRFNPRFEQGIGRARSASAAASREPLFPDMLGENSNDMAFNGRSRVEHIGCDALDGIPQG